MRRQILLELQSEYEARRQANEQEYFRRLREVESRSPDIARLMEERQGLILRSIRQVIGCGQVTGVEEQMAGLNDRIRERLRASGYDEAYLEPVYTCPVCRDTGYVGEPVREMCDCMKKAMNARLYREVGLSEKEEQTFETFRPDVFPDDVLPRLGCSQRDMMLFIREKTKAWAEKWPDVPQDAGVLFSGPSGLGKTFLMHAMVRVMLDRGLNVMMLSSYRAQDMMRRAYFGKETDGLDMLMEMDVLFLDDFGTEPMLDNVTVTQFLNLINERRTRGRACVFSTNLAPVNLMERYTERISSRLLDRGHMLVFEMRGEDIRKRRTQG